MKTLQSAENCMPSILYRGRALSQADILSFSGGSQPLHRSLPLLASAWLGLLLVVCNPILGIAALFAAPMLQSHFFRSRRA